MLLKTLGIGEHNPQRPWGVEFHEDFLPEFRQYSDTVRGETFALIELLAALGPQLGRPYADTLKGSMHSNMKELRFRADGGVWRIAFALDVKRRAILLVGGSKSGGSKAKFYSRLIEIADARFAQHQRKVALEGRK
jgi:hypothetical protein